MRKLIKIFILKKKLKIRVMKELIISQLLYGWFQFSWAVHREI